MIYQCPNCQTVWAYKVGSYDMAVVTLGKPVCNECAEWQNKYKPNIRC